MHLDFLRVVFAAAADSESLIWEGTSVDYRWLLERFNTWNTRLGAQGLQDGSVVILEADFSPEAVALLLALLDNGLIVVPLTSSSAAQRDQHVETAIGEWSLTLGPDEELAVVPLNRTADHEIYRKLRRLRHPGLVLFTSGSTGPSKAAVHDFTRLREKYTKRRHDYRTLAFMLFDHIGGIDTLFYALSNGSAIVTLRDRTPAAVCRAIEDHRVEVLPVTPTFLNLLILSEAYRSHDLSSLKYITYGSEVMPPSTLRRVNELFPEVTILQKYGTTEVGTLRSVSKCSDSVWVKLGGEGYETRVVDDVLHVRARAAILGYLNAPSPFTADGWFITGDEVEVDAHGEYIRILGRKSDVINVGGDKVYPTEVENAIQELPNIHEVSVHGESNAITGSIVCAVVTLLEQEDPDGLARRVKRHCRARLHPHKVPVRVKVNDGQQHSDRFKKVRST